MTVSGFSVEWVETRPKEAGKKLGYSATLAVLHKFRDERCRDAVLETDDPRLPAIKTYLQLGFRPDIVDPNQPERWRRIFESLGKPELSDQFCRCLSSLVEETLLASK